jgi:hypothetical protein
VTAAAPELPFARIRKDGLNARLKKLEIDLGLWRGNEAVGGQPLNPLQERSVLGIISRFPVSASCMWKPPGLWGQRLQQ